MINLGMFVILFIIVLDVLFVMQTKADDFISFSIVQRYGQNFKETNFRVKKCCFWGTFLCLCAEEHIKKCVCTSCAKCAIDCAKSFPDKDHISNS